MSVKKDPYDIDFMSTTAKVPWYDKIIHSMYGAYSFQVSWVIFGYYLVYFYTDVVGLSATVAGTIMLVARFAFTVALMIGVFLMKPLIKLFRDTGRVYQICMAASAGFSILLFVLCKQYGPTAAADSMRFGLLFIVFVINAVFSGAYYSFSNVMIPATVDYGEWKNGNGQAGIVSAINGFCITIGAALGAQIMGILLDGSGYVANQTQSDATLNWLLILAFVIPAVVTIIHFVLQMFYGLNDKRLDECMQEVWERRKKRKIWIDKRKKLTSVTSCFATEERAALAEKMIEISPEGLDKVMFGCTGSDANEFALKLAKYYQGGGRIISFRRGFHGSTAGAAAATGKSEMIQESSSISELLPRGFVHSAPPYCYHCDFGKEPGSCNMQCLKYLEQTMLHEGGDKIAAVISEPIFAAGGVIVPPKGFWQGVRDLCDKYGALLIFDEVVTGIGQTGTMFACEYEGVTPDILVTGKGLTSGYVPGSAVLCRREIGEAMSKISLHGHTHSCYPMTCRSALKNIEIIERENLVENSRVVGDYLHEKLKGLMEKYDVIKDVRGRGLLQGIELEGSRNADKYVLGQKFYETMLGNGLITELESRRNLENVVVVMHPALITSKENVDEAVEIIDKSLKVCLN